MFLSIFLCNIKVSKVHFTQYNKRVRIQQLDKI